MTCDIIFILLFVMLPFLEQERMFQFWFNTFFISQQATDVELYEDEPTLRTVKLDTDLCYFDVGKEDLDKAHKDVKEKIYNRDFKVSFQGASMGILHLP